VPLLLPPPFFLVQRFTSCGAILQYKCNACWRTMCEYNWRVYDGTTPADAVEGGKDANGVTFYIALVHLKLVNEKLAGMIIPSTQTAYISSFAIAQNVRNDAFTEVKVFALAATFHYCFYFYNFKFRFCAALIGMRSSGYRPQAKTCTC
jgi:hypothetical protein